MDFPQDADARFDSLEGRLRELGEVLVAFSGGVDSAVLLHAARRVLGDRAAGLIADSPSLPRAELAAARELALDMSARLFVVQTDELANPRYVANTGDRCYFCKATLFRAMEEWARAHGHRHLAYGEITDDLMDERPGARAAGEHGVCAPLREAGLGKDDVRAYARRHGLAVADKPAMACLASRIPVGTRVTRERLLRIEHIEAEISRLGIRVLRVRDRAPRAGVEVGAEELERAQGLRAEIEALVRLHGFEGLELSVYRSPAERTANTS